MELQVLVYGKYECFVMQMVYVCVHPVVVLNASLCLIYSLLMLVEDAMGDHMEVSYSRAGLMIAPFCLPHAVVVSDFIICRDLCVCVCVYRDVNVCVMCEFWV